MIASTKDSNKNKAANRRGLSNGLIVIVCVLLAIVAIVSVLFIILKKEDLFCSRVPRVK